MIHFKFKPLSMDDLNQLQQWLQEPLINHYWYAENKKWSLSEIKEKFEPRILGTERVPSFIVHIDNLPIGFIQYYLLTEFLPDGIKDYDSQLFQQFDSQGLVGIDLFIASDKERGKGLGVELISEFISKFLTSFKAVLVDPSVENVQAIRCYEKIGFEPTTFSQDPNYIIMLKSISFM